MTCSTLFRLGLASCALVFLASCAELEPRPSAVAPVPTPMPFAWNGDGVPGAPKIVVHINEQRAYFYKGKVIVGESTVSTGKAGFSTPPGSYKVVWKNKDHISTRFGDYVDEFGNVVKSNVDSRKDSRPPGSRFDGARMPFAMFFRGGYAMHQGYVPPYAASHGCIRLPAGAAEIFFDNAPYGTPVIVKQSGSSLSRLIDQEPAVDPASTVYAPPAPSFVRSTPPAYVPPAPVRPTAPAPTPVPVRSPGIVIYRPPAPAPIRSPAPASVRSTVPVPAPTPVRSTSVRSTVPVPAPTPVRTRAVAPAPTRGPARLPTPTPTPTPARRS